MKRATAGLDDVTENPYPETSKPPMGTAGIDGLMENDPSIIPEDIKELVEAAHRERLESRPDENWTIAPAPTMQPISEYKRDPEDMAGDAPESKPDVLEQLRSLGMNFDEGGVIPDQPGDPNQLLQDLAPLGTGTLVPSPAQPKAPAMQAPMAPPAPTPTAPMAPAPHMAASPDTDQTYMDRANKLLGLNPEQQAGFMKLLGDRSQKAQIGAGIAGIGDAIASGGTLGKVNPGALNKSEELIQGKENSGINAMQTIRGNQEKSSEMADKLQARDPKSPLSRFAQKAYASVGQKIGIDLSNAPASMIADITGKGVDALNTQYQNQLKMMGLDLQKKQVEATIGNQKAERDITRQGQALTATEKLGSRTLGNKLEGIIPGTSANTEKKSLERIAGGAEAASGPVKVNSVQEYQALPTGTHYVDSFGTEKVKK